MKDPRYERLGKLLVNYSLGVRKGHILLIQGTPLAEPLVTEAYREALRVGAHPTTRVAFPALTETFYKTAKKHQLEFVSPVSEFEVENVDRFLSIWAEENTKSLTSVDPRKQAVRGAATGALFKRFMEREAAGEIKWCGTQFPCNAAAQDAEMSLSEYEDFVLRACLVHKTDPVAEWKRISRKQARIARLLNTKKKIRVVSKGTDLSMVVKGRTWINCDGTANMPDGEVFTTPLEDSVEGTIAFSFPAYYGGKEAHGVKLTFRKGKVVRARANRGQDFLEATIDTDEGARRVGEFAIGTNYAVQRFTKNTLFDEKIGGTIHLALGAALPESGGQNDSGIHWDIVNDMRDGGTIYADGRIIYKDGKFTIK